MKIAISHETYVRYEINVNTKNIFNGFITRSKIPNGFKFKATFGLEILGLYLASKLNLFHSFKEWHILGLTLDIYNMDDCQE